MEPTRPLSLRERKFVFGILVLLFVLVLPVLYLYATGYKLSFTPGDTFVSTGGMYVAADRTGAEIYIDDELVRETRAFRRAFYAQGLTPGTHKVHVQKPESHTWVKELPVYPHVVTEAQAFNLPLLPEVRVISAYRLGSGEAVLPYELTVHATTSNPFVFDEDLSPTVLLDDTEYQTLEKVFEDELTSSSLQDRIDSFLSSTGTTTATTTKVSGGVALFEGGEGIYARYVGARESMPYYYCAPEYEPPAEPVSQGMSKVAFAAEESLLLDSEVTELPLEPACDPTILLDNKGKEVIAFDFYPGSTDLAVLALTDGLYVVEVDDRGWQNMQPLLIGDGLDMRVYNGSIYAYDGAVMYHIIFAN